MGSRETILSAVRKARPPAVTLPDLRGVGARYDDPIEQFARVLSDVGGRCVRIGDFADLPRALEELPAYREARRIASLLPGVPKANVDLASIRVPHELADIDFALVRGEFAVAENAAVWVLERRIPHRALLFLTQHLGLVVPAREMVHNLHEAYDRIGSLGAGFTAFISGPSKTADIEQALVIGAHGPRSATVFLVG